METFEGRGAVITGGASGIGFASAQEFTRRGARVVLADIDQSALDAAVEQLRADGAEAHGVVCDVTSWTPSSTSPTKRSACSAR